MNSAPLPRVFSVAPPDELRERVFRFIGEVGGVKRAASLLEVGHLTLARVRDGAPVSRASLVYIDKQLANRAA